MTIHKFTLQVQGVQKLSMPAQAKVLTAQLQEQTIKLWAVVDPEADPEERTFEMYGTGSLIKPNINRSYVATVQMHFYVWHIFEILK